MVPFLLAKFWPFLKWYDFKPPYYSFPRSKGGLIFGGSKGLNEKSPNGTFLLTKFSLFLKWYHFSGIFGFFKMIPFLLAKFRPILKWYHFKPPFPSFPRSKGEIILGALRGLNEKSPNGTFFVDQF